MRISTNTSFLNSTYGINAQQNTQAALQEQITTTKRVNRPSDDPVASARILDVSQASSRNDQFITNTKAVNSALKFSDTALESTANLITQLKELAVKAGNGSMSDLNLKQTDAQLTGMFKQLVGLANQTDGDGNYLFSGTKSTTTPYVMTETTDAAGNSVWNVAYAGNDGQKSVPVSSTRQIAITDPGSVIFGKDTASSTSPADSLFATMQSFHELLQNGSTDPAFGTKLQAMQAGLDKALDRVVTANATVGSRMNEADSIKNTNDDLSLVYSDTISKLQDLDLVKAASDLTRSQTALSAALLAFSKVKGLSLFNYI